MKNNSHINFLSQNVTALFQHVSLVFQATKINYQLMQSKLFDNKLNISHAIHLQPAVHNVATSTN